MAKPSKIIGKIVEKVGPYIRDIIIEYIGAEITKFISNIRKNISMYTKSKKKILDLLDKSKRNYEECEHSALLYKRKSEKATNEDKDIDILYYKSEIFKQKAKIWKEVYEDCSSFIEDIKEEEAKLDKDLEKMGKSTINEFKKELNKSKKKNVKSSKDIQSSNNKSKKRTNQNEQPI